MSLSGFLPAVTNCVDVPAKGGVLDLLKYFEDVGLCSSSGILGDVLIVSE